MSVGRGNVFLAGGPESTKGTPVASGYKIGVKNWSLEDKNLVYESEQTHGSKYKTQAIKKLKNFAEGGFESELQLETMARIIRMATGKGSDNTAAAGNSPQIDRFDIEQSDNPETHSLFEIDGTRKRVWPGACLNTLTIKMSNETLTEFSTDFKAHKSITTTQANNVVADTSDYFEPSDFSLKRAGAAGDLSTADNLGLIDFELVFDRGLEQIWLSGNPSKNPDRTVSNAHMITGSFSLYHDDDVLKALDFANTKQALSVVMSNGVSGSGEKSVAFTLGDTRFINWERTWNADALNSQKINFTLVDRGDPIDIDDLFYFVVRGGSKVGGY